MKTDFKKLRILVYVAMLAMFGSCFGNGTGGNDGGEEGGGMESYPMPSPREECARHLNDVLHSSAGWWMTPEELASLSGGERDIKGLFDVGLPVNDTDVLPRLGVYRNPESGGFIKFREFTEKDELEPDTIHPVCAAEICMVFFDWESKASLPDSTDAFYHNYRVQNRGKGIFTLYHMCHRHCFCSHHDDHPDGFPEWLGAVFYVYPGADSIKVSVGYRKSHRMYYYQGK